MSSISRIQVLLHGLSGLAMAVFVYLYVSYNAPGLTDVPIIAILGAVYVAMFMLANPGALGGRSVLLPAGLSRVLYAATAIGLPLLFLNATVWDYYQPVSLYEDAIYALALSWSLLIISSLIALVRGQREFALAAIVGLLGLVFVLMVHRISNPVPASGLAQHMHLFTGGEGGYDTYRIPALLVLPAGSKLADDSVLETDRMLAMAEARRDGDLDTGVIDLVMRVSDDGGRVWSEQQAICRYEVGSERGKCGNATPLFDRHTGTIWLAYNLSGISAQNSAGHRAHSAQLMQSNDGGLSWLEPRQLPFDNLVFGPGHGIQKQQQPAEGRLILPGSRAGSSLTIYSDDAGETWQAGEALGLGNENEIAELSDGTLFMATRHNAPVGSPPQPNGRLHTLSTDGGHTWGKAETDTRIPTPICQASVLRYGDSGGLLFSNPADEKARVHMTVRASQDDGLSWNKSMLVYPGPAGYSQLGALSDGDVVLLYEQGRMEYSERISFARIDAAAALLSTK